MIRRLRKAGSGWLLTIAVLAVTLGAGSRLIWLSVQHHEVLAREQAAGLAAQLAGKIEPQLRALAAFSRRQAAEGTGGRHPLAPGAFWLGSDDKVLAARPADAALATAIAGEWAALDSEQATQPTILGPIRQGREWLVAARTPVFERGRAMAPEWSVTYANLDALIAPARLGRLVNMGYDFELDQIEPRSARSRAFVSSDTQPVADAVAAPIHLPPGFNAALPGSYLRLALRPRDLPVQRDVV